MITVPLVPTACTQGVLLPVVVDGHPSNQAVLAQCSCGWPTLMRWKTG